MERGGRESQKRERKETKIKRGGKERGGKTEEKMEEKNLGRKRS